MTKRTDPHSPANINPPDYRYLGFIYQGPVEELLDASDPEAWDALEASSYKGNFDRNSSCDHCGARFSYGAVFVHVPTGDAIAVGNVCAKETFGEDSRRSLDLKRTKKAVAYARQKAKRSAEVAAFLDDNPGLAEALETDHSIIRDIAGKLMRYGSISEKQVALVQKLHREAGERAEAAANEPPPVPVVEGRRELVGVILGTRSEEGWYGDTTIKGLLKTDEGEKLWGTIPSALLGIADNGIKGCRVVFHATVSRSRKDECFGFWSRPTKAQILEEPSAA